MTDNIVHFRAGAKCPMARGHQGISLFLIPKFLVNADGSLGAAQRHLYASGFEQQASVMSMLPDLPMTMATRAARSVT